MSKHNGRNRELAAFYKKHHQQKPQPLSPSFNRQLIVQLYLAGEHPEAIAVSMAEPAVTVRRVIYETFWRKDGRMELRDDELLSMPVGDFPASERLKSCLFEAKLKTFRDVVDGGLAKLAELPQESCGKTIFEELFELMKKAGFYPTKRNLKQIPPERLPHRILQEAI